MGAGIRPHRILHTYWSSVFSLAEEDRLLHNAGEVVPGKPRSRAYRAHLGSVRPGVIDEAGGWAGGAARQNGMEAWRLVFRPALPTLLQVVELTNDSLK